MASIEDGNQSSFDGSTLRVEVRPTACNGKYIFHVQAYGFIFKGLLTEGLLLLPFKSLFLGGFYLEGDLFWNFNPILDGVRATPILDRGGKKAPRLTLPFGV